MNRGEYMHLLGEKTALTRMIADTPEDDVIDRASLMARLNAVERALEAERSRVRDGAHRACSDQVEANCEQPLLATSPHPSRDPGPR